MPHTDLKVIQISALIEWNGSFRLDVFDTWLEFLEEFYGHGNFSWSSAKGNFLKYFMSNIFSWWKWGDPVLKYKMSQITDKREEGNWEVMADQVITMEPEINYVFL